MTWHYQEAGRPQRRYWQCIELTSTKREIFIVFKRFIRALRKQYKKVQSDSRLDRETKTRRLAFLMAVYWSIRTETRSALKFRLDCDELLNPVS